MPESQKLESLSYISAIDNVDLCLLLFTQLYLKSNALSHEVLAENGLLT